MASTLEVEIGQFSSSGIKSENQDAVAFLNPQSVSNTKGVVIAVADGISSSPVSKVAAESAVTSFIHDYYSTPESWTVKTSAIRVFKSINSWLKAQSEKIHKHLDKNRGYVCTFSAVIFKDQSAHCVHVGDSRIYRLNNNGLEQLTKDHRLTVSAEVTYLAKALGIEEQLDPDFHSIQIRPNEIFLIMTDGVYEFVDEAVLIDQIQKSDKSLDDIAQSIVDLAISNGSDDNCSIQIAKVLKIGATDKFELPDNIEETPLPPILEAGMEFDGFNIVRELYKSSRSNVYLAKDISSNIYVVIKTPTPGMASELGYIDRFLMEEWIARRINSQHVVKMWSPSRKKNFIYTVSEYIDGQTLDQWILDYPDPSLDQIRGIVEQVASGLRAFHRLEMVHQDIKPENIMIDRSGTVKIIDFGSTLVLGILEKDHRYQPALLGTALYSAPEYFLGQYGGSSSDQYSLGVLTYFMLSRKFPYSTNVPKATTKNAQRRLIYTSVLDDDKSIPQWIDGAIRRATQVEPHKRYEDISEFIYDLKVPNPKYLTKETLPLMERNPTRFWQAICFIQTIILIIQLATK